MLRSAALWLLVTTASGCSCGTAVERADVGNDVGTDAATVPDAPHSPDAPVLVDASGPLDAPVDARLQGDGGSCDPSRVRFSPSGMLEEGQLCDDVFVCAATPADASALMALAPSFDCSGAPQGDCAGTTCVMRPSTLDADEVAQICTATVASGVTAVTCMIYL